MRKTLFAIACSLAPSVLGGQEPWMLDRYKLAVIPLEGSPLGNGSFLNRPSSITIADSLLLVIDRGADKQAIVVSKRTGQSRAAMGPKGSGPGEYRAPASFHRDPGTANRLWIHDVNLRRLTRIDFRGSVPITGNVTLATFPMPEGYSDVGFAMGGVLIGTGFFADDHRLSFFTANGTILRRSGRLPVRPQSVPPSVWQEVQRTHLAVSPSGRRIAMASRYADRIEFADSTGKTLGNFQRHFSFEPQFAKDHFGVAPGTLGPAMTLGDKVRYGYVALTATENHVYAVFSGKVLERFRSSGSFGNYIHVFDWTGRPVAVYQVSNGLIAIAAEPDGSRLYGIRHEPEPAIMVYTLPRSR